MSAFVWDKKQTQKIHPHERRILNSFCWDVWVLESKNISASRAFIILYVEIMEISYFFSLLFSSYITSLRLPIGSTRKIVFYFLHKHTSSTPLRILKCKIEKRKNFNETFFASHFIPYNQPTTSKTFKNIEKIKRRNLSSWVVRGKTFQNSFLLFVYLSFHKNVKCT